MIPFTWAIFWRPGRPWRSWGWTGYFLFPPPNRPSSWIHNTPRPPRGCEVDDQEIRRGGVSFSIETLRDYARRFPSAGLFYLIGADNAAKLNTWREPEELARLAEFVVVPRPGGGAAQFVDVALVTQERNSQHVGV